MKLIRACLCPLLATILAAQESEWRSSQSADSDDLLLNGVLFPPSIYIPLDRPYVLECSSSSWVRWKVYLSNGTIVVISETRIRLIEFDKTRDGFYQCVKDDNPSKARGTFVFSNGNRTSARMVLVDERCS